MTHRQITFVGLLLLGLVLPGLGACRTPERSVAERGSVEKGCIERYDPAVDYFPHKAEVRWAEGFSVTYHRHYKVVDLHPPGSPAERYVLVRCGTPVPTIEDAHVFETPIATAVTTSTTEIPAFVRLGVLERLIGVDRFAYVNHPAVRARIESGKVAEIGTGGRINLETVIALSPDVVFGDVLGDPSLDTGGQLERLRAAGIDVVRVPSYLDTHPLGLAEWIKYVALFFDREAEATAAFDAVEDTYSRLAAIARDVESRPTVIVGNPRGDVWHVPGGQSFAAQLLADAGADYPWAETESTGSLALATERVFAQAVTAEVWLHPWAGSTREELIAHEPRLTTLPAFATGRVYPPDRRINADGGNDYWESGMARPDLVLADLIAILHPEHLPEHDLVFHRRLDEPREIGVTHSVDGISVDVPSSP